MNDVEIFKAKLWLIDCLYRYKKAICEELEEKSTYLSCDAQINDTQRAEIIKDIEDRINSIEDS